MASLQYQQDAAATGVTVKAASLMYAGIDGPLLCPE
jgi:hypothetical protein